jgi:putative ABC transport system substrate-binding protein
MKRRDFITLLGGAAAASVSCSLPLGAEQAGRPIIGYLNAQTPAAVESVRNSAAFQQGLREAGYVDGQNVTIEYRWAEGRYERLPALANELVERSVAVIAATGSDLATRAAKAATATIPIVFSTAGNPVQSGFVASFNRPGGNITGVTTLGVDVAAKRLQLLREAAPTASAFALLVNPSNSNTETILRESRAAAQTLGSNFMSCARLLNARSTLRWRAFQRCAPARSSSAATGSFQRAASRSPRSCIAKACPRSMPDESMRSPAA